jgi:hypothetical protein
MKTDPRFSLEEYHENSLGMRTVGWVLITFAGMFLWIFVFISERNGSLLIPIWAVVQTLVGFALVGTGMARENSTAVIEAEMAPPELRHDGAA